MKIEIFYAFGKVEYFKSFINFFVAQKEMSFKKDLNIVFKSGDETDYLELHLLIHFLKRKYDAVSLMFDIYELIYEKHLSTDEIINEMHKKYNFELKEFKSEETKNKLNQIVENHYEHAKMKKVDKLPFFIFGNGVVLKGYNEKEAYENALIGLYKFESDMEYCEGEECER